MSTPTMDRATAAARRVPAAAVRFPQVVATLAVIGRIAQGRGDPPGHRDGPLPRPRATWRTSASWWHRRCSPAPGAAPSLNFRPPPPAADRQRNSNRPPAVGGVVRSLAGDTLVVWRLDRLGRSSPHLIETIGDLEKRGVGFKSVQAAACPSRGRKVHGRSACSWPAAGPQQEGITCR